MDAPSLVDMTRRIPHPNNSPFLPYTEFLGLNGSGSILQRKPQTPQIWSHRFGCVIIQPLIWVGMDPTTLNPVRLAQLWVIILRRLSSTCLLCISEGGRAGLFTCSERAVSGVRGIGDNGDDHLLSSHPFLALARWTRFPDCHLTI